MITAVAIVLFAAGVWLGLTTRAPVVVPAALMWAGLAVYVVSLIRYAHRTRRQ